MRDASVDAALALIAEFEKANPDIKVQYEVIPVAEYSTKLITAFAAVLAVARPARFAAGSRGFVASPFSRAAQAVFSRPVRSYQLCCVAGSLWGRPHVFSPAGPHAACTAGSRFVR